MKVLWLQQPPRPPKLKAHHYECCACQKLITHECASDWKTSPILQTADPAKVATLYKERKQATTFDFAKYLRSEEEFCDLYVADNNRTIKCRVCQTMAHPIKSHSSAPRRSDLMAHVRGPKHRKKKEEGYIQDILGEEESEPEVPKEKQKTILCKPCNKFVARDSLKFHRTCKKHMQMVAANPVQEDLTKLPATEANNTVKAAFEEALRHGGITENKIKYFRPFLKRFCLGGGAIAVKHASRVNKNKRVRPKMSTENSKEDCNNSDESDDDDEDNQPVELPML